MSGIKYNSGVSNYKNTPYAISDLYTNLGNYLPNIKGALYFANDGTTETILQANGTSWIPISSAPGYGSNLQQVTDIGAASDNTLLLTGVDGIYVNTISNIYSLGSGNRVGDGAGFYSEGGYFGIGQYSGFGNGLEFVVADNINKIYTSIPVGGPQGIVLDFDNNEFTFGDFINGDAVITCFPLAGDLLVTGSNKATIAGANHSLEIDFIAGIKTTVEGFQYGFNCTTDYIATLGDYAGEFAETKIIVSNVTNIITFNAGFYQFNDVPTYATNALAVAGGLTAGQIYKNASGSLSIVL